MMFTASISFGNTSTYSDGNPRQIAFEFFYQSHGLVVRNAGTMTSIECAEQLDIDSIHGWSCNIRVLDLETKAETYSIIYLFENYSGIEIFNENGVITTESQLNIPVGDSIIKWSQGGTNSGWLYYDPSEMTVQPIKKEIAGTVDLFRFR